MTAWNARRFIKLLCGLALSIVSGMGFAAPNLIANPSFDSSLAGWTVLTGYTATWSPVDAGGNVNSDSARVVNEQNSGVGTIPLVLGQCVRVTPSTEYSFGGRLMVPAGQPAVPAAGCRRNGVRSNRSRSDFKVAGPEIVALQLETAIRKAQAFYGAGSHWPTADLRSTYLTESPGVHGTHPKASRPSTLWSGLAAQDWGL